MSRALSEFAQVNPQVYLPAGAVASTPVSFVPMSDVTESGDWVGRQVRKLGDVRNGFTMFADEDVLVAKITPCFENGKGAHVVGLTNGVGFGSTEFHVLRARDGVSPRFVHHITQSARLRKAAEAYMSGSAGQRRVPREFFDVFMVPDLSPPEQVHIAKVLDTLDTTIRQTEAIIEKLKQVKQGLLHDLLTRGIDANGELRPPQSQAPHLYKDSPLGWIPTEWAAVPLASCTNWSSGGTPNRAVRSNWVGQVPLLTPKDMKSFELADTTEHISEGAAATGTRLMPADTVFIVVRGMILAHTFPVVLSLRPMAFNQDIKAVCPGPGLRPRFLAHWFAANKDLFLRKVTESTHGTKKLDADQLLPVHIGLPPEPEQQAVVERYSALDARIATEKECAFQLLALKSGLMDDLLTGRVRVTPLLDAVTYA